MKASKQKWAGQHDLKLSTISEAKTEKYKQPTVGMGADQGSDFEKENKNKKPDSGSDFSKCEASCLR